MVTGTAVLRGLNSINTIVADLRFPGTLAHGRRLSCPVLVGRSPTSGRSARRVDDHVIMDSSVDVKINIHESWVMGQLLELLCKQPGLQGHVRDSELSRGPVSNFRGVRHEVLCL